MLQQIRETLANTEKRDDSLLRAIAAYPDWYLVVDNQNCACLWTIDGKQTLGVMTERNSPDGKPHSYLEMRGRHLMRNLPEEAQVIAFDLGSIEHGVCVQGEALNRLSNIALALDCEEALAAPPTPSTMSDIKNDVDHVLAHEWIVLWNETQPLVMPYKGLQGAMLFTALDTTDAFLSKQTDPTVFKLKHMAGHDLFEQLVDMNDYDGVYINAGSDLELFPFAPAQIHELTNGRQPRPERKILRARSLAELHHYLDECGMDAERPNTNERIDDGLVEHYTGKIMPGLEARSFRFYPVVDTPMANAPARFEWGQGTTEIVCAGKLADLLRRRLEILNDEPKPLGAEMKPFVHTAIVWASELQKLIDPTTRKLPRHSLRTVDGARFVREYPQIATSEFVDSALTTLSHL